MDPKKKKKLDLFVSLTRKQSKEDILKEEKKLGRPLDRAEKKSIIRKNELAMKKKVFAISLVTFGLAFGVVGGIKALTDGKGENSTQIETEVEREIEEIPNEDKDISKIEEQRQEFTERLAVDQEIIDETSKLKEESIKEIESLENSEATLKYLKDIYAKNYNEMNNTNITAEDIKMYKTRTERLYADKADNGDEIFRTTTDSSKENVMQTEMGIIKVVVCDESGNILSQEKATQAIATGEIIPVYREDETALSAECGILGKTGNIISNGIDLYTAQKYEEENEIVSNNKLVYMERLTESLTEYKESQRNINQKLDIEKDR